MESRLKLPFDFSLTINITIMASTNMASNLREELERNGFISLPAMLSAVQIEKLREACNRSAELARSGNWPFVRTLPKQFPPWNADVSQGIWGVQHLLHPDLPDHDAFAATYFNKDMVNTVTGLLQCDKDELVMELYNMLIRPDSDFALRWHRDDIPPTVPAEEELKRLQEPMLHAQWNLALDDDSSLVVVPGSHKRARTDMERTADPFEDDMPGQKVVKMRAGDILFYNNNILHRGIYDSKVDRMTLHGTMGVTGDDPARSRNVLQHGVGDWVHRCDFKGLQPDMAAMAEQMKQRLIAMGSGEDVGFSQADP